MIAAQGAARRRGAHPGGRSRRGGNGAAHPARREAAQPFRPGRVSRAGASIRPMLRPRMPPCARPSRRSACRPTLIEVIGRMPDYVTGSGYRIVPVLGVVQPGFELVDQRAGGRRRIRGAARFPDESRQSSAREPRLAGARALLLHHALRRPLHLGRDGRHHPHALREALRVSEAVSIAGKADWLSNKHLQRLLLVLVGGWRGGADRRRRGAQRAARPAGRPTSTSRRRRCPRRRCGAPRRPASRRCRPASSTARSRWSPQAGRSK